MFALALGIAAAYLAYNFVRRLVITEKDVETLDVDQLHKKLDDEITKLKKEKKFKLIEPTIEDFNSQIFNISNKGRDKYTIDLHGLYVTNSIKLLKLRINQLLTEKYNGILTVITGQGNHSVDKIARIKPKVIEFLKENNFSCQEISKGGALIVYLSNSNRYCN